jgi:hypothetical protein
MPNFRTPAKPHRVNVDDQAAALQALFNADELRAIERENALRLLRRLQAA